MHIRDYVVGKLCFNLINLEQNRLGSNGIKAGFPHLLIALKEAHNFGQILT